MNRSGTISDSRAVSAARLNVRKLFVIRGLRGGLAFSIPTIVLFWSSNGLSMADIFLLQALFTVAVGVFEVPCGYFADRLGRRWSITLGSLGLLSGVILYGLGGNFLEFLSAELMLSLGLSFISGADQALLYESLVSVGRKEDFDRLWGRIVGTEIAATALYFPLGSVLAAWGGLRLSFVPAVLCYVLMLAIGVSLREVRSCGGEEGKVAYRDISRVFTLCFVKRKILGWYIAFSALLFSVLQVSFWVYQPYLLSSGVPIAWNGALFAVFAVVATLSSSKTYQLLKRWGRGRMSLLLLAALTSSLLLLGSIQYWWSFVFIFLQQFTRGVNMILYQRILNEEAEEGLRATTVSLKSMCDKALYALLLLSLRPQVESLGEKNLLLLLGVVGGFVGAVLLLLKPSKFDRVQEESALVSLERGAQEEG